MPDEKRKPLFPPFDSNPRLVLGVIVALFLVGVVTRWVASRGSIDAMSLNYTDILTEEIHAAICYDVPHYGWCPKG